MIIGKNIRLRRVERADLPSFVSWLNDPEVRDGIALFLPISPDEEIKWYENMLERPQEERVFSVELRHERDWRLVGSTGLFRFDWIARSAEFGIAIGDKTVWGQGYGTETTCLILKHSFESLNLNRVFLRVFANNTRAIRAYEKAGFIHEGILRQDHFSEGKYVDTHLMSVLRADWEPGR